MCGIVGYIGNKNAQEILLNGLKSLEYRGYDSAGIALVDNNDILIIKEKGKIKNLEEKLIENNSHIGIGHTRWATHGEPSITNSHPHQVGKITIVHNGIIENYEELKKLLLNYNYEFKSETDTEVLCALIDKLYEEKKDIVKVLNKLKNLVKGSYALGVLCSDNLDTIYAVRAHSPLIIGVGEDESFIASDVPAILKYTNKYILLDNYEIAVLNDKITIYNDKLEVVRKKINTFEGDITAAEKNGYEHFMLKEINEESTVIRNTIFPYIEDGIESLINKMPDLSIYNKIDIVACGSAYHTGLIGKVLIEKYANIEVTVDIASEYRYKKHFFNEKTLVILVSQSGETADTLASLRIANENNVDTLGIINAIGSSIARESKYVLYIKAGCEIAVATTKAYSAQIAMFSLLALNLSYRKNLITDQEVSKILKEMKALPDKIKDLTNTSYLEYAEKLYEHKDIFFLGRGIDYPIAQEGSLKLKEISYIHSEAYAAGELKHGTISLINEGTPVIGIITDPDIALKTISNIKETSSRGAYTILVTTEELNKGYDCVNDLIVIPNTHELLQPILTIIPLQLISYEIAKLRKCDIDKPRNLAKSVTVE